jgi:hypothetical protein
MIRRIPQRARSGDPALAAAKEPIMHEFSRVRILALVAAL